MVSPASESLRISSHETPSATVLRVSGEVDLVSAASLKEHLMRLIMDARGRPIIVDCSALQYLDMTGVHVLETCHDRAKREGVRLVLVGSGRLVHRVLTIVQLNQRIRVVETMEEAVARLGHGE